MVGLKAKYFVKLNMPIEKAWKSKALP